MLVVNAFLMVVPPSHLRVQYSPSLRNSPWPGDQWLGTELTLAAPRASRGWVSCPIMIAPFPVANTLPSRKRDCESSHRCCPRSRPDALTRTGVILAEG